MKFSADLAGWPPGVVNMVAHSLMEQVMRRKVKLKSLQWQEPGDESCASMPRLPRKHAGPHRKTLRPAYDQGGTQTRYFPVGILTSVMPLALKEEVEDGPKRRMRRMRLQGQQKAMMSLRKKTASWRILILRL